MWFDLLCWFHEVIWMMEDMPPKKQSHLVKWWNKPTHSSHDVHASSQECNFPLFRIIHFLFNRSRLIYLDLASDQVQLCIRWGGGRGRKKNKRELYVDSLSNLHGIFPTQGSNPGLPHCRQILYQLSHQGSPTLSLQAKGLSSVFSNTTVQKHQFFGAHLSL